VSGIKALHESLLLVSLDEMDQLKHIQEKEAAACYGSGETIVGFVVCRIAAIRASNCSSSSA
jgi:hypothetical protein